ncbi:MAG TPA: hypothetical protein VFZ48_03255 [Candidatus Saccharimonadales bacterium]
MAKLRLELNAGKQPLPVGPPGARSRLRLRVQLRITSLITATTPYQLLAVLQRPWLTVMAAQ